jgi:hypothetical protein
VYLNDTTADIQEAPLSFTDVIAGLDPAIHHAKKISPRIKPAGDGRRSRGSQGTCSRGHALRHIHLKKRGGLAGYGQAPEHKGNNTDDYRQGRHEAHQGQ